MKQFNHRSGKLYNINDASIYYETIANEGKPVLLFLHGGGGDIIDLNPIVNDVAGSYHIIGIDSRGHGRSTAGKGILSYEILQKDVETILSFLKITHVNIIGFSDGGITGYRLAAAGNIIVDKLVTIGGTWSAEDVKETANLLQGFTAERWQQVMPASFERRQQLNTEKDTVAVLQKIKAMWLDETSTGYPNESVKNIQCPTLIVRGDEDRMFSRRSAFTLAAQIPNARLLNLPFADHGVFTEQKEIFLQVLKQFLQEKTGHK